MRTTKNNELLLQQPFKYKLHKFPVLCLKLQDPNVTQYRTRLGSITIGYQIILVGNIRTIFLSRDDIQHHKKEKRIHLNYHLSV